MQKGNYSEQRKIIMDDTMKNLKSDKPLEDIITEIYQETTI